MGTLAPCTHLLCSGVTSGQICSRGFTQQLFQLASHWCTRSISWWHRGFSSAGQLLHLPVLLSPCTGPCLAPLSPPDSTGKKTPQPGELLPLLCRTAASLWAPLGSLTLQQVSAVKAFCPASSLKALKQTKEVTAPQTEIHSGVKKLWKHSSHLAETRQVVTHLQDENVSTKF